MAHAWRIAHAVRAAAIDGIEDVTLAYAGVQVRIREHIAMDAHLAANVEARIRAACQVVAATTHQPRTPSRTIDIPVCYDADFGLDLEWLARETRLTIEQVIALHIGATYQVHFLGFLPGFAYMGGLPQPLRVPRHTSPRTRVPAGSVAIAGAQTGIYPSDTPGGWRILGRTPLTIFDPAREQPSLLLPGDTVRFVRVDRAHDAEPASPAPRDTTPTEPHP